MTAFLAASLIFAQATAAQQAPPPAELPTIEDDRLLACMREARNDPAQAITTAIDWLQGTSGAPASKPQECLGFAYMGILRWQAAKDSFVMARDARVFDDYAERARLGAMAGNAALAGGSNGQALALLRRAQEDALTAQDNALAGQIASEKARALVAQDRADDAATALEQARDLAPQNADIWLLSATLARRMDDLPNAQNWIETADLLAPNNPSIGLEAGVIAMLGGFEDAARNSWLSVVATSGGTPQAETARAYLAQLEQDIPGR